MIGEKCTGGQREQGNAQLTACAQLQNSSAISGIDGITVETNYSQGGLDLVNITGLLDGLSEYKSKAGTTMLIPGTDVLSTYLPPTTSDASFMCYNFQASPFAFRRAS